MNEMARRRRQSRSNDIVSSVDQENDFLCGKRSENEGETEHLFATLHRVVCSVSWFISLISSLLKASRSSSDNDVLLKNNKSIDSLSQSERKRSVGRTCRRVSRLTVLCADLRRTIVICRHNAGSSSRWNGDGRKIIVSMMKRRILFDHRFLIVPIHVDPSTGEILRLLQNPNRLPFERRGRFVQHTLPSTVRTFPAEISVRRIEFLRTRSSYWQRVKIVVVVLLVEIVETVRDASRRTGDVRRSFVWGSHGRFGNRKRAIQRFDGIRSSHCT